MIAEAGEAGVGVGEFQQSNRRVANGQAESIGMWIAAEGAEAEAGEECMQWGGTAEGVEFAHGGDIERAGERAAERDRAAIGAVVVFR